MSSQTQVQARPDLPVYIAQRSHGLLEVSQRALAAPDNSPDPYAAGKRRRVSAMPEGWAGGGTGSSHAAPRYTPAAPPSLIQVGIGGQPLAPNLIDSEDLQAVALLEFPQPRLPTGCEQM